MLLPKMSAVFGSWDWLPNGVLYGAYHLHQPWMLVAGMGAGALLSALPAKRFGSTLACVAAFLVAASHRAGLLASSYRCACIPAQPSA